MPTSPPSHVELDDLQRAALVLAGHHVPAERAATILNLASTNDVLDVLDAASEALGVRGYYRAYVRAGALGLLQDSSAARPVRAARRRSRLRERDRGLRPGRQRMRPT